MNWDSIIGHEDLKKQLQDSIDRQRVSHAQLFVGDEGYGTLPLVLAYAKEILASENEKASQKVAQLNHVDVHFSFPVFSEKGNSLSSRLFPEFRNMILENPYASLQQWGEYLESNNKQFLISADEIDQQNQKFSLKSYEGGTKVLIIWRADKMNISASNKLLKFLEEPPEKTIILLTTDKIDSFLPTILSRSQIVEVGRVDDQSLTSYVTNTHGLDPQKAASIVHKAQGNVGKAIELLSQKDSVDNQYEDYFVTWVRSAVMVKKNPTHLKNILQWAQEISFWNREKQKGFLEYCIEAFRQAMLENYQSQGLVYSKVEAEGFKWDKFAKFINGTNIQSILEQINQADLHLTRNGNAKIIWTDLGVKLSRYIHQK